MCGANANANNANASKYNGGFTKVLRGVVCNSPSQLKMGIKVPGTQYSFWCERKIRSTNGTKRGKYGEKYSGVNAPIAIVERTMVIHYRNWMEHTQTRK